jgi:hypothetical protein
VCQSKYRRRNEAKTQETLASSLAMDGKEEMNSERCLRYLGGENRMKRRKGTGVD